MSMDDLTASQSLRVQCVEMALKAAAHQGVGRLGVIGVAAAFEAYVLHGKSDAAPEDSADA